MWCRRTGDSLIGTNQRQQPVGVVQPVPASDLKDSKNVGVDARPVRFVSPRCELALHTRLTCAR